MLVSIIVPVYNVESYLRTCVDSILNQTYKDIELILVDDGSKDKSGEICDEYASKDSRVRVIHQENKGLSGARNTGIENMTGELLMFVDSDDWISSETCERAVDAITKNDVDIVFWSYAREYGDKSLPRYIYSKEQLFVGSDYEDLFLRLLGNTTSPETLDSLSSACNKCFRVKDIAEKVRFVDCSLIGTEDLLYNVGVFSQAKSAYYINEAFYHYRKVMGKTLTTVYKADFLTKRVNLFNMLREQVGKDAPKSYHDAIDKRIALDMLSQVLFAFLIDGNAFTKNRLIRDILNEECYKTALEKLSVKGMRFRWKVYYSLAKCRCSWGIYFLTRLIKILKKTKRG